jgi:hypothetical protein
MTALLVIVTLVSLGVAGALLVYLLRLTRLERDRSDARAAALSALLPEPEAAPRSSIPGHGRSRGGDDLPLIVEEAHAALTRGPMFGGDAAEDPSRRPRWLAVPAIGVVVVGLTIAAVYAWNRPSPAAGVTPQTQVEAVQSIELVSLRHQRQNGALVVSGLVRNPTSGKVVKGLSAVVFSFDRQGTFLTSGRASLDFPQLAPGDESPFAITLAPAGAITRYRVSFRTDQGTVPHVDRRSEQTAVLAVAGDRK